MKKKISAQAMKDIIYSAAHFAGREKDIRWEEMGYWDITGRKPCAIIRFEQPYGDPPDFMEATFFFRLKEPGGNELEAACYLRGFHERQRSLLAGAGLREHHEGHLADRTAHEEVLRRRDMGGRG